MSFAAVVALTLAFAVPWRGAAAGRAGPGRCRRSRCSLSSLVAGLATGALRGGAVRPLSPPTASSPTSSPCRRWASSSCRARSLLALGAPFGLGAAGAPDDGARLHLGPVRGRAGGGDGRGRAGGRGAARRRAAAPRAGVRSSRSSGGAGRAGSGSRAPRWPSLLWVGAERPALLIATSGGRDGRDGPEGRALSHGTGESLHHRRLARPRRRRRACPRRRRPGRASRSRGGSRAAEVGEARACSSCAARRRSPRSTGCGGADLLVTDQDDAGAAALPRARRARPARDRRRRGLGRRRAASELVTASEAAGDRPWTGGGPRRAARPWPGLAGARRHPSSRAGRREERR